MGRENKMRLGKKIRSNIILLLLFIIVMLFGAVFMRQQLIKNAMEMSSLLLNNYSTVEESKLELYKSLLTLGTKFVNDKEQANASIAEIKSGLYPYLNGFSDLYANNAIRSYGVIDGYIFSNHLEFEALNDSSYDYTASEWYQGAIEADGEIYITDAYKDYLTGECTVTLAQKVNDSNSVLAFDIFFNDYHVGKEALDLPENASYYLCDGKGTLMYYESIMDNPYEQIQAFVSGILEKVSDGSTVVNLENYYDLKGNLRSVYIRRMQNDWILVLTIPQENTIGGMGTFYFVIAAVFLFGIFLISYLAVRDYKREKNSQKLWEERQSMAQKAQIYQKTMSSTMLAYREVYYVDLNNNTYQLVYPERTGKTENDTYQDKVMQLFADGRLVSEEQQKVEMFLSLDYMKKELAEKEYIEIRCQHKDMNGVSESCVITITVADMVDGRPISATLAIRSIENMLRQEEAQRELLSLAVQQAETANRAKSDFLSSMSHDIRTPMNAILGMTAIALLHIDDKERVVDALNKISLSGKHLLGLINSVLDMSKIESGKISLTEEEFNLSDSVEKLLTLFHTQLLAKNLGLKANIAVIEHENVIGDDQRLQQIFVNIMGNAIKFTPEGGTITLNIREKKSEISGHGCYEFIFEDTGIGMEKEFVERIFEPFSRAADSRTTRIEGTGLGMSIAVNIARMMGGDIQVESELGKGSKFIVTVYLKINHITQEDLQKFAMLPVLVVDDEETACENACEILSSLDMYAEYVLNGDDAVARLKEAHQENADFSVVILDWQMPEKDGVETAREIRKVLGAEIPIIILSAYDWSEIEQEATLAGVNAFLEKPLFKSRLIHVLKEVLGVHGEERKISELESFRECDYVGKRVLLVEDNELNIEVAGELLDMIGLKVDMAHNGKEAVEKVSEQPAGYYDMIFMDIQMPVMNGYEATAAIRSMERQDLKEIPIVAMTADAFADDVKKSIKAGMNGHIAKPIDIAKLEKMIKEWMR